MATRRGGNATVTMAAAGSSLGPTCLSLFLVPLPLRSPLSYGPLPSAHGLSHEHTDGSAKREGGAVDAGSALSRKLLASSFCSFRDLFFYTTTIAIAIAPFYRAG